MICKIREIYKFIQNNQLFIKDSNSYVTWFELNPNKSKRGLKILSFAYRSMFIRLKELL